MHASHIRKWLKQKHVLQICYNFQRHKTNIETHVTIIVFRVHSTEYFTSVDCYFVNGSNWVMIVVNISQECRIHLDFSIAAQCHAPVFHEIK